MTQAERDRLVTLKKARKGLITQREAAEEVGVTVRHVKRLLQELKKRGDKAAVGAEDCGGQRARGGEDSVGRDL